MLVSTYAAPSGTASREKRRRKYRHLPLRLSVWVSQPPLAHGRTCSPAHLSPRSSHSRLRCSLRILPPKGRAIYSNRAKNFKRPKNREDSSELHRIDRSNENNRLKTFPCHTASKSTFSKKNRASYGLNEGRWSRLRCSLRRLALKGALPHALAESLEEKLALLLCKP